MAGDISGTMIKKILVVDDEKNILDLERQILEEEGFEVISACDGKEALEKINKEVPDLMVLDINMPKIDGYEVCRKVGENPLYRFPVIILTGERVNKSDMKRFHFIKDYIFKPFNYIELVSKVKKLLS